jgi:hypothetical protein
MTEGPVPGEDVVAAVDGQRDPSAVLSVAAAWAMLLQAGLRVVTVYEPVLADTRRPEHFSRTHGPSSDPHAYLQGVASRFTDHVVRIELVAIPDPVSVAGGLVDHLAQRPAFAVVAGGQHRTPTLWPGALGELIRNVAPPVLVVPVGASKSDDSGAKA